ncbi:MAG: LPS export ABC transporter periplasmic protein LptC [Saprospiraceae bacterium]|nr:LPS export ABC transporter periplasmic protein LptC [Saprospiraceae bacterium]
MLPVFTLLAPACERRASDVLPDILLNNPNLELLEDVEILYSDSAFVKVRVRGPVMLYHTERNDPRQEFIEGVEVDFLDRNQEVVSRLTAKYAIRRESIGTIIVRDSVVWQSSQNERLTTDEMTWDERLQKVFTDRFVVITRPEEILYGRGFEADQDFTNITMKAVEGRVKVDNQEGKQDQN